MKAHKKLTLALFGAVAALALASIGWAAIPDSGGVIHGCYKKDTGALRVFDDTTNVPKTCTDKEAPLDWNQQGPPGLAGVHEVTAQLGPWTTGGIHQQSAHCPGTEEVLAVGYTIQTVDQYGSVLGSAAARVESVHQVNKVGGWGNTHGFGTFSVSVDPTKLPAGKGVGGTFSVTCATVAP